MPLSGEQYATAAIFAGTFIMTYVMFKRLIGQSGQRKYPPSIGCVPILGSAPYMPSMTEMHTFFLEKSRTCGSVVSFSIGNVYTIVLNSHEAIREAFVKRSIDFADRPKFYFNNYLNPQTKGISDRFYNAEFKKYHQLSLSILKKFGFGQSMMENRIILEVEDLISNIKALDASAFDPRDLIGSAILNVMSGMLFGHRLERHEEVTRRIFDMLRQLVQEPVDLLILDFCPALRFLPSYSKLIRSVVKTNDELFELINRKVEENIGPDAEENFISCFIREEGENFDREQLMFSVRDLIMAGTETSSTSVLWALALLADYPDVQRHLQEEIDSIVPRDRLPSLDDRQKLPYVEAAILELMRCKTLAPLGAPHTTMCDTEVDGYFIPKGAMVFTNLYAAHMNPDVWPEPHVFRPERFLSDAGDVINKDMMIGFSLGKRSCLGEQLARQELYLFIAGLVQQFDIRPPEGLDRVEAKEVVMATLAPTPFKVRLLQR